MADHRVLHGRHAFVGHRRLLGCYIQADDWRSRLRVLEAAMGESKGACWALGACARDWATELGALCWAQGAALASLPGRHRGDGVRVGAPDSADDLCAEAPCARGPEVACVTRFSLGNMARTSVVRTGHGWCGLHTA
eukprot:7378481-Prymnesium_polylepis.1